MPPAHPVRVDAMEHASKDWPREAVGGVIERLDGSLGYYPLPNVSTAPDEAFNVPPEAVAEMMAEAQVVGVHHSHPRCNLGGKTCSPSGCDMQAQLSWNVPFYITFMNERAGTPIGFVGWGDQLPPDDLRERTFMSGINDCYSLVRHAYFRLHGIVLPDGPRDDSWWNDKGADNPIMGNLTTNGFERVSLVEVEPGDGLLFSFRRQTVTHCGVYLGGDLFLHHLYGRLSSVDQLPQWKRHLQGAVRYAPGAQKGERHDYGDASNS